MSNCLECGRLVAPSSGLFGPISTSIFCCRQCLNRYYEEQPGLWEQEEHQVQQLEQERLDQEEYHRQQQDLYQFELLEAKKKSQDQKRMRILYYAIGCFILFLLLRSCH
jgi:hypothetical protein